MPNHALCEHAAGHDNADQLDVENDPREGPRLGSSLERSFSTAPFARADTYSPIISGLPLFCLNSTHSVRAGGAQAPTRAPPWCRFEAYRSCLHCGGWADAGAAGTMRLLLAVLAQNADARRWRANTGLKCGPRLYFYEPVRVNSRSMRRDPHPEDPVITSLRPGRADRWGLAPSNVSAGTGSCR